MTKQSLQVTTKNSALLVIDKQHAYFDKKSPLLSTLGQQSDSLDLVAQQIDNFINFARGIGLPIVWLRMVEDVELSPANIAEKIKSDVDALHHVARPGDKSFEYYGAKPLPGELEITKKYYSILPDSSFEQFLSENRAIDTFILVGGYTSRCLFGSVFSANSFGYRIVVPKDLVGVPDKFSGEIPSALRVIDSILGFVTTSGELKHSLKTL